MKVNSVYNSNNTTFNGLYVSKQTLKAIGCSKKELLNNRSIREAAEKYDVLVKAGDSYIDKFDSWSPLISFFRAVGMCTAVGIISACTLLSNLTIIETIGIFPSVLFFCFIPNFAIGYLNRMYDKHKSKSVKEIVIQAGKGIDSNEDYIQNCRTRKHVIESPDMKLSLVQEVKEAETEAFNRKIKNYNTDDLFSADKYLKVLKDSDIELLGCGDFFNRKIDEQGNTMLTQFFDVIPTEENKQEYEEILNILKKTKGINYNQKDGNGISCIEKIIFSENEQVLPLIKGSEFDYSNEIEILYNNIQNLRFKALFDSANLKFNFNDILQAVKLNSWDILTKLRPKLNSPLCNRSYLANQIKEILENKQIDPQNRSDYNAKEYVYKYYNEYVNPDKVVRLNEWNHLLNENGEIEYYW